MTKPDQEILSTFTVEPKDGVIYLIYYKNEPEIEDDVRQAEFVEKRILEILERNPEKTYTLLVDLLSVGSWRLVPGGSRRIYARIVGNQRIKKVGVAGKSTLLSIAAKLILEASGKGDTLRWFTEKEEALKWLAEQ